MLTALFLSLCSRWSAHQPAGARDFVFKRIHLTPTSDSSGQANSQALKKMSRELSPRRRTPKTTNGSQESKNQSTERALLEKTNCSQIFPEKGPVSCNPRQHFVSHNADSKLSTRAVLSSKKDSNKPNENSEHCNKLASKMHR